MVILVCSESFLCVMLCNSPLESAGTESRLKTRLNLPLGVEVVKSRARG